MAGRKVLKISVAALAVAVCLVLLWPAAGGAYASRKQRQVENAWVGSFGTLQDLLKRYPKSNTNETARRLEELVKPLGLDLTPKDREVIIHEPVSRDSESWKAVSEYLTAQLQKPEATIDPPPQEVGRFLNAHIGGLSAIEETLLNSPSPAWSFDPTSLPNRQVIPSVRVFLRLQRALLAEALVQAGTDNAAAERTLEASWKLNNWLRETPDLVCQLIALAIARTQVGALRKVEVDDSVWRSRLAEHDFKRSVFDTQLLDLWPRPDRSRQLEEIEYRSERSALKRLKSRFEEPYGNIVWSEALEKMRLAYLRIKASPVMGKDLWDEVHGPRKNASDIIVSIQMPNMVDCFKRVDRLVIESELTDKILEARQLRRENNLRWPPSIFRHRSHAVSRRPVDLRRFA